MAGVTNENEHEPKLMALVPAKVFMAMQYLEWCRECQIHWSDSEIGDKVKRLDLEPKESAVKIAALGVLEQYFGGESDFKDVTIPDCMPASKPDDDRPREPVTI